MKSIVIEQVQNGFLVSQTAHRCFGDHGPHAPDLFVYRTIAEVQADLPRLMAESTTEPETSTTPTPPLP